MDTLTDLVSLLITIPPDRWNSIIALAAVLVAGLAIYAVLTVVRDLRRR